LQHRSVAGFKNYYLNDVFSFLPERSSAVKNKRSAIVFIFFLKGKSIQGLRKAEREKKKRKSNIRQ